MLQFKSNFTEFPKGPFNNIPKLVQIMAWCRLGDKPLSVPMMAKPTGAYMLHSASKSFNLIRPVGVLYCLFIFLQSTVSRLLCDTSGNTWHKICWTYLFFAFLYWLQIHIWCRINIFGNPIIFYRHSLALLRLKNHWRPLLQSWMYSL